MASNRNFTVGDMFRSLAIVFAVVGVIVIALPRSNDDAVKVVDITQTVTAAERAAPYDVRVPTGLSSEWRSTSVRLEGGEDGDDPVELHIGYVTPSDDYASVKQTNDTPRPFVRLQTMSGQLRGTRVIGGRVWDERFAEERDANSLVLTGADGVTVVVTGTAGFDELAELAASLR